MLAHELNCSRVLMQNTWPPILEKFTENERKNSPKHKAEGSNRSLQQRANTSRSNGATATLPIVQQEHRRDRRLAVQLTFTRIHICLEANAFAGVAFGKTHGWPTAEATRPQSMRAPIDSSATKRRAEEMIYFLRASINPPAMRRR